MYNLLLYVASLTLRGCIVFHKALFTHLIAKFVKTLFAKIADGHDRGLAFFEKVKHVTKRKAKKTTAAPEQAPAPAASTLQQLQRAIERADAAFAALRPEPVHAHFGPDVENQDDLDRFDADRAEVQRATEQALACVSHGDLYRSRGEALKGCFKPLAQARRKAAPWTGRGPDNSFAAAFDLLRRLLSEEGVALPQERPRAPAQSKPSNGKAKGHGNGRTAASADLPAADPEKDRALLAAFSAAIADAVKGAAA